MLKFHKNKINNNYFQFFILKIHYKSSLSKCENYNPSSDFDDKSCTSIIPDDYQMVECVVDGNPKKCVSKKKTCEQTIDEKVCLNLEAGTDKRCAFTNGKCEALYNEY